MGSGPVIQLQRVYDALAATGSEPSASEREGARFLVERLWPRGVRKDDLVLTGWLKDVAPSSELRRWFGHRPERWSEFRARYWDELDAAAAAASPALVTLLEACRQGSVTLLYSARDRERNSAVVLRDWLLDWLGRG